MGAVTKAELEALVKRQQKSLDRAEAKNATLQKSLKRATTENKAFRQSLKEALEQQTATSEILQVISRSPTDTQPVFDAIVKRGAHLFGGLNLTLRLVRGDELELVASTLAGPGKFIRVDDEGSVPGHAIQRREVLHVPDLHAENWISEGMRAQGEQRGFRAIVAAPLLREDRAIGIVGVSRAAPGPFTDKQIALLRTFAAQAVIAIENARLFNETKEALEQQTATTDILKVISSSPTDLAPVFDAILERAARLCDAHMVTLGLYDGENYEHVAQRGANPAYLRHVFRGPYSPASGPTIGRMIAERRSIHIADMADTPGYKSGNPATVATVELGGARSALAVPMLKDGRVVGGMFIYRPEVNPFTEKQVELVSTFADQAVIAIENVRLFKELQAKNAEVTEALEQQTVTSDILKVISSSPTDIQPVFDAIAESAARVCGATDVVIRQVDGDAVRNVAHHGALPVHPDASARRLSARNVSNRAVLERRTIHIHDALDPHVREEYPDAVFSWRTLLVAPLLRDDAAIGVIFLRRQDMAPFSDKQVKLLETFASQAVIAIENVRLFKELQARNADVTEALDQQTIISDILRIISSSPTETQPVFDAIVRSGQRLFGGMNVTLRLVKGDQAVIVASTLPANATLPLPFPLTRLV